MRRKKKSKQCKIDENHKITDTNASQISASWKIKDTGRKLPDSKRLLKEIQLNATWSLIGWSWIMLLEYTIGTAAEI